jgi:hypothetical protein
MSDSPRSWMGWEQDPAVGPETRGLLPAIPRIPGDVCGSVAEDHPEARRDEVCGDADCTLDGVIHRAAFRMTCI